MDAGTQGVASFDTNVLVAASIPDHIHHESSLKRLVSLQKEGGACAAHPLAEAYNTLTKFPRGYGVPATDAAHILSDVSHLYHIVALTSRETLEIIESAAGLGVARGRIFDAPLLACARRSTPVPFTPIT